MAMDGFGILELLAKEGRVDIETVRPGVSAKLIQEVKERPLLWDPTHTCHRSSTSRNGAWDEIAMAFFPEYDQMSVTQQQALKTNLNARWNGLRDSFNRETKRKKKCAANPHLRKRRQYYHYEALRFLEPHTNKADSGAVSKRKRLVETDESTDNDQANGNESDDNEYGNVDTSTEREAVLPGITEELIQEVKKRPQLWDTMNAEYNSVSARNDAWDAIALRFFPEYNQMTETQQQGLKVNFKLKWRGLRNRYAKEYTRRAKSAKSPYVRKKRLYIHYNALRFLEAHIYKVGNLKSQRIEFDDPEPIDETVDERHDDRADHNNWSPPQVSNGSTDDAEDASWWAADADADNALFDENCVNLNQEPSRNGGLMPPSVVICEGASVAKQLNGNNEVDESLFLSTNVSKDEDEDRLFVLSLVSQLKQMNDFVKLEIKSELLMILTKARLRDNS